MTAANIVADVDPLDAERDGDGQHIGGSALSRPKQLFGLSLSPKSLWSGATKI
jgi:hypothetical protein